MPKAKIKAPEVVVATVEPSSVPALSEKDAKVLDAAINTRIRNLGDQLAHGYLDIAKALKEMRDGEGYRALGHESWESYLDSKQEFGRSYLSYLYKLGQAGDLSKYVEEGMSGTKLIEFAKRTDYPEKIPQLIEATWETVKDSPVRETAIKLNQYVAQHEDEYRREKTKKGGRPKLTQKERWERDYEKLSRGARTEFLDEMQAFLIAKRPTAKKDLVEES